MKANRRGFLGLLGVGAVSAPLAAKAAADAAMAGQTNLNPHGLLGFGNASLGLPGGMPAGDSGVIGPYVSYEQRLIGAADYIKMFGMPEVMASRMWDEAKTVYCLDPDIACKKSWSLSVKIMTQRQRNYERAVKKIEVAGWQERGRQTLKRFLGFDWPW